MTTTASYTFNVPAENTEEDNWGALLNANWEKADDLLDGTSAVDGIDIDGGTIDGTPIGANSASTGAFTSLTATTRVNSGSDASVLQLYGGDGANGAQLNLYGPSSATAADEAIIDADVTRIRSLDGTDEYARFTSTGLGVNITPTVALSVVGASNGALARFGGNASVFSRALQINEFAVSGVNNSGFEINAEGTGTVAELALSVAGTRAVTIDDSQNVGIGTATPGSRLSIVGLPTSAAGLSAGDVWNDSGTLKIVT